MKKILSLLLVLSLILTGCAGRAEGELEPESPCLYYYRTAETGYRSETGVIQGERREIAGHEEDISWILEDLLKGPRGADLVSPFPKDLKVLDCQQTDKAIVLEFSGELSNLSGVELSVAAACIARTLFGVCSADTVSMTTQTGLLNGKQSLTLSREGLLLEDGAGGLMRTEMTLCFGDLSGRYLIGETITVSLANTDNVQEYLMERLAEGPKDQSLRQLLPGGTRILGVTMEDGICNVNLSRSFLEEKPETALGQRLVLTSIANTLAQSQQVAGVELYVEGTLLTSYGVWQLNAPLVADEEAVGPVRTGLNEFDVDLYLPAAGGEGLVQTPARIRQTASETAEELILSALIGYEGHNSLVNPFPTGTQLRALSEANGVWIVDLSRELLSSADLQSCVRAIVLTLGKLEAGKAVRITVEGATPSGDYGGLFYPHVFEESWILR